MEKDETVFWSFIDRGKSDEVGGKLNVNVFGDDTHRFVKK